MCVFLLDTQRAPVSRFHDDSLGSRHVCTQPCVWGGGDEEGKREEEGSLYRH